MTDKKENNMLINEVKELHASILEISKSSFEIKKLCITTIGIFNGFFLSKLHFSNDAKSTDLEIILTSIFATLLITILFHITDATTYFFQRKNRERQSRFKKLLSIESNPELFNLKETNWISSFFNSSMIMYIIIYLMGSIALTYLTSSTKIMTWLISIFLLCIIILFVFRKKKRKYS
ncbi:TPA: hypothetical protein U2M19_000029 [Providencia rettgeri]|uniref:hypothetical protein n=1 Tax=Providencia rettgeri TaxID=587 RepID=UPI0018C825E0|nr:hypothetical protein [Providencia rettgeri]MBG5924720.1 hypothetical protein [Providencia rettgeri]HEM8209246.1 hypothetical protein [Providencia rettgeri]